MAKPWKWQSDEFEDWWFEKPNENSKTWIEYNHEKKISEFYSEVSSFAGMNGDLAVILSEQNDTNSKTIKLTDSMLCYFDENKECRKDQTRTGFWKKKFGIKLIKSNFFSFFY